MRVRNRNRGDQQQPRLQMSSMIDVVFLLLIFFVMTFQITAIEGDFAITSTQAATTDAVDPDPPVPPFRVRLTADSDGNLASIRFDNRSVEDITSLHNLAKVIASDFTETRGNCDDLSINLHCDPTLKYEHAMSAITALRGEVNEAGEIQPLIHNIRFAGK